MPDSARKLMREDFDHDKASMQPTLRANTEGFHQMTEEKAEIGIECPPHKEMAKTQPKFEINLKQIGQHDLI